MARDKNPSLDRTCVLCRAKILSQWTLSDSKTVQKWKILCLEAFGMLFDLPLKHPFLSFLGENNGGKLCNRCLEDTGKIHSTLWMLTKLEEKLVEMRILMWSRLKINYDQLPVQTVFGGGHRPEALLEESLTYEDVVKIIFEEIKTKKDSWPEFSHRKRWRKACESHLDATSISNIKLEPSCESVLNSGSSDEDSNEEFRPTPESVLSASPPPLSTRRPRLSDPRLLCTADPDTCSKTFSTKKLLQAHISRCHRSSPSKASSDASRSSQEICEACGISLPSQQMKRHFYYHHQGVGKFKCEICFLDFPTDIEHSLHSTLHSSSSFPFQCVVCQYLCTNSMDLRSHVASNHLSSGLKCPICGIMKPNEFLLQRHVRVHDRVKRFSCAQCGKQFSTNAYLKYHEDHYHTNAGRKFPCEICGKEFRHQKNVQRHLVSHREEKPHKCQICGKTFNYSHLLKKHEEIHSGTKNYECHLCGKRFKQEQNLKQHMKSHKPKASKKLARVETVEETTYTIEEKETAIPVILQVKGDGVGNVGGSGLMVESNIIEATIIPTTAGDLGGEGAEGIVQAEYETVQEIELGGVTQEIVGEGGQTATVVFLYEYNA